jgi:hypothetical protein
LHWAELAEWLLVFAPWKHLKPVYPHFFAGASAQN